VRAWAQPIRRDAFGTAPPSALSAIDGRSEILGLFTGKVAENRRHLYRGEPR
jgi:hypothetical protein